MTPERRFRPLAWLAAAILLLPAAFASAQQELVHSEKSLYRQVLVYEDADMRCLCFTRACAIGRQSCQYLKEPDRMVFEYTQMMLGALFLNPDPHSVLIIGLGGGTLPRALEKLLPQAQIDVVEIDPAVSRVAQQYFGFKPDQRLHVFEEDGRAYVRRVLRTSQRYDLIMLDAYDHQYIPEHLLTREFLQQVHDLLRPHGIVAANTFSSSGLYDNESVTYSAVFGRFFNLKSNNRVILTADAPLPPLADIHRTAQRFDEAFKPFGFTPESVADRFSTQPDWNTSARVLTDQYSPANLLNGKR